eukprot:99339-Chlamydomonas_euryale.AAC.2
MCVAFFPHHWLHQLITSLPCCAQLGDAPGACAVTLSHGAGEREDTKARVRVSKAGRACHVGRGCTAGRGLWALHIR